MLLEISSIMFGFGKTYTPVFPRFSAVASPESLANTGFSGLRHLAASSVKIIQAGFVPPVLKTVRAKVHRGSNPSISATICPKTRFGCEFSDFFIIFLFRHMPRIQRVVAGADPCLRRDLLYRLRQHPKHPYRHTVRLRPEANLFPFRMGALVLTSPTVFLVFVSDAFPSPLLSAEVPDLCCGSSPHIPQSDGCRCPPPSVHCSSSETRPSNASAPLGTWRRKNGIFLLWVWATYLLIVPIPQHIGISSNNV